MHNFIEKLTVIEELTDTRQQWKVKHKIKDILFIVLAATIANADEWVEMEIFAQHIVSAYCSDDGYTIGQTLTDEKSNETTATPELLEKISSKRKSQAPL